MRHFIVAATTAYGIRHFVIEGDTSFGARDRMASLLVRGGAFTDEVGRVYGAWEIDPDSLQAENRAPVSSGGYRPFRVDGRRIRQAAG